MISRAEVTDLKTPFPGLPWIHLYYTVCAEKERKPKIKAQIKAEVLDYKEDEFGEQPLIGHDTEKYEEGGYHLSDLKFQ